MSWTLEEGFLIIDDKGDMVANVRGAGTGNNPDCDAKAELIVDAVNSYRGKGHAENCVILSCDFHTRADYDLFYHKRGHQMNGFTGIYDYILTMADAMSLLEQQNPECWEEYDWVEVSEQFVAETYAEAFLDDLAPMPQPKVMLAKALRTIEAKQEKRRKVKP